MAEPIRNGGNVSTEIGIPTGLNRIKTRRESSKDQRSAKPDDDGKFHESRPRGISRPPADHKYSRGLAKFAGYREGLRLCLFCVCVCVFFLEFLNSAWLCLVAKKVSEQQRKLEKLTASLFIVRVGKKANLPGHRAFWLNWIAFSIAETKEGGREKKNDVLNSLLFFISSVFPATKLYSCKKCLIMDFFLKYVIDSSLFRIVGID